MRQYYDLSTALADPARLGALRATELLDSPPDEQLDRLATLATTALNAPVALVTLVDSERQFFKACVGLPAPLCEWRQTPLAHSFCQHALTSGGPLVIPDAREDPRVRDNLAVRDFGAVAYLGIPLILRDADADAGGGDGNGVGSGSGSGHALGSFCVIDRVPRQWTERDVWTLQTLARAALAEIELRRQRNHLAAAVDSQTRDLLDSIQALRAEIEERRRVEFALRHAIDAAKVAGEAKDRFLAVLSHELRTPLTPVLLFASAMEKKAELPVDVRETFALIRQQVELEARLIDDLLDVTAISRGKLNVTLAPVDAHACVQTVCQTLAADAADHGVTCVTRLEAPAHLVRGDAARLKQVLWNLMKNAIKFSRRGSTVTVRTRNEPSADGAHAKLCIEVLDHGVGIAPAALARIFEPFEQGGPAVTREFGGLGLGLTIARALVELHDGRLDAHSDGPGHGATFAVRLATLPSPAAPAVAASDPVTSASPPRPTGLSVLVVDDHAQTARAMAKLLSGNGHRVTTAASADQALDALARHPFDVLVCDISLGDGGTGHDLMRDLRARSPAGPPGIALSGHGADDDVARSLDAGFTQHLTKPIELDALEAAIRRAATPK